MTENVKMYAACGRGSPLTSDVHMMRIPANMPQVVYDRIEDVANTIIREHMSERRETIVRPHTPPGITLAEADR